MAFAHSLQTNPTWMTSRGVIQAVGLNQTQSSPWINYTALAGKPVLKRGKINVHTYITCCRVSFKHGTFSRRNDRTVMTFVQHECMTPGETQCRWKFCCFLQCLIHSDLKMSELWRRDKFISEDFGSSLEWFFFNIILLLDLTASSELRMSHSQNPSFQKQRSKKV